VVSANVVEAMRAPDSDLYARAVEPIELTFPQDHGAHPEYRTEWWYYTGNLETPEGDPLGFQLTFFRSALTPFMTERTSDLASNQVYMGHFAVSDGRIDQHYSFDRYSRGAGGLAGAEVTPETSPRYRVWLEDWVAEEIEPGVINLRAQTSTGQENVAIDLILRETLPPLLHGEQGLHQKGLEAGNASYYYSLTGLDVDGTVTTPDGNTPVTGQAWMDHEFGTSALSADVLGWDWFSVQLENGDKLMLYQFRMAEGAPPIPTQSTLRRANGEVRILSGEEYAIEALDSWTSPRTGIVWPMGWQVTIPSEEISLNIQPLFEDQEMNVQFVYWEGAIEAEGTLAGEPISGTGYVEMTGAGGASGEYQR
jgi:predicted secreted hydrolase